MDLYMISLNSPWDKLDDFPALKIQGLSRFEGQQKQSSPSPSDGKPLAATVFFLIKKKTLDPL